MVQSSEEQRINDLRGYEILDTPPDGYFDEITSLAVKIFEVPIAIISLVDTDRIWFKSTYGIDAEEISRDPGLCSSAILSDDIYIVEDARKDPRTLANPLVAGILGLQFYAAAPLISQKGYRLGTICLLDKKPRVLNAKQSSMLMQLGRMVMEQMEMRLQSRLLVRQVKGLL